MGKVVKDFYKPFNRDLAEALKATGKVKPEDIPTETMCEKCGLPMVIRWGRHGRFLACTGFPKCKNTKPLQTEGAEQSATAGQSPQETSEICEKCGSPMVIKAGRYGKFLACSRYPECKNTRPSGQRASNVPRTAEILWKDAQKEENSSGAAATILSANLLRGTDLYPGNVPDAARIFSLKRETRQGM